MKNYFLIATMHSGKQVYRVITGHKALRDEMQRILSLSQYYKDYVVYDLATQHDYHFMVSHFQGSEYDIEMPGCFTLAVKNGHMPLILNHHA